MKFAWAFALLAAPILCLGSTARAETTGHAELVRLFQEWRAFVEPAMVDGAPDYSPAAIARQRRGLAAFQRRLRALDDSSWPVTERIDRRLAQAEMRTRVRRAAMAGGYPLAGHGGERRPRRRAGKRAAGAARTRNAGKAASRSRSLRWQQ